MISKTVVFKNYNDEERTKTLYFHISKVQLADNLDLEDEFGRAALMISGEKRELTKEEVQEILTLIKRLIKLGYGERSEDGEHFRKSEQIYADFHDSAAYDALLWEMFTHPEDAVAFMTAILPSDLVEKAKKELDAQGRPIPQDRLPKHVAAKDTGVKTVPGTEDIDVIDVIQELPSSGAITITESGPGIVENPNPPVAAESVEDLERRLALARERQG
jgi:hypothetical protein